MIKQFTLDNEENGLCKCILMDGEEIPTCEVVKLLNTLNDENKQLKQFKEYVFDLIDKEIKETKEIFEDGKIDLMIYNASMITLTGLKEQLKGDVE